MEMVDRELELLEKIRNLTEENEYLRKQFSGTIKNEVKESELTVAASDSVAIRPPRWFEQLHTVQGGTLLHVPEWEDLNWRQSNRFVGTDFCHSDKSPVRILDYVLLPASPSASPSASGQLEFPSLVGAVYFSPTSESGPGYCHGGTMCAIMDDVIGWMGFCCTGSVLPWSGFTAQINTSLKRPVTVGSILKLEAKIVKKEKQRKFWVEATLVSGGVDGEEAVVYAEGSGLFLLKTSPDSL